MTYVDKDASSLSAKVSNCTFAEGEPVPAHPPFHVSLWSHGFAAFVNHFSMRHSSGGAVLAPFRKIPRKSCAHITGNGRWLRESGNEQIFRHGKRPVSVHESPQASRCGQGVSQPQWCRQGNNPCRRTQKSSVVRAIYFLLKPQP